MIQGQTYTNVDYGIIVWRMETDAVITIRSGGENPVFLDANGFACKESGKPEHYELSPNESITIQKSLPNQSNVAPPMELAGTFLPAVPASPPQPKPIDIPVEIETGRHIDLEDV